MAVSPPKPYCHTFVSYFQIFACIWPRAPNLGCITNVDMLFLVMRFIYEISLCGGGHISNTVPLWNLLQRSVLLFVCAKLYLVMASVIFVTNYRGPALYRQLYHQYHICVHCFYEAVGIMISCM